MKRWTVEQRVVAASPERTFAIITDGWMLPVWVVGATHIRDVDEGWPAAGTKAHHRVGAWPCSISDATAVLAHEPPRRFLLRARVWPFGAAQVELVVEPHAEGCLVRMSERPVSGLARWTDNPAVRSLLAARNRESLQRLASIAEHRRDLSKLVAS